MPWSASAASPKCCPEEERRKLAEGLGRWFSDYLIDAGYQIDESPTIFKQMILSAFPRIMKPGEKEITTGNIEQVTLNFARVYNHYLEEEDNAAYIQAFARGFGS